jgi:nondiscriminating aspartyl-tRNA synthetase
MGLGPVRIGFARRGGLSGPERPFYTHPERGDSRWTNSFDLIFRGLELVTGGQRLHIYATTRRPSPNVARRPSSTSAYLQAFRHGMPPHGGFALGLE